MRRCVILLLAILGPVSLLANSCGEDPTGVGAERTIHVDAHGTGDFPHIQAAVDNAADGDTIELADGYYSGEGNRDIDFHGKTITIRSRSGIPDSCILSGGGRQRRAFIFQSGEGRDAIVDGLRVTGFSGRSLPLPMYQPPLRDPLVATSGGALLCRRGASPTIKSCVFTSNYATRGGIVFCYEDASPRFQNCTVCDNTSGAMAGLFEGWEASLELTHTLVAFNNSAVVSQGGTPLVAEINCCDFFGNLSDWAGEIDSLLHVNGNTSKDPRFADLEHHDLSLLPESPCLPDSSECGLIGALGME